MAKFTGHPITDDSALGGSVIERSLRIDQGTSDSDSGSNYSRTFASGNRKTFTISVWVKKCNTPGNIGDDLYTIISCGGGGTGSYAGNLAFNTSDQLVWSVNNPAPSTHADLTTTRKFRDPSAWYHIVFVADTTQGTNSNRLKLYVDGVQETDFASTTYPSQNYDLYFNLNVQHRIGSNSIWSDLSRTYGNFNGYFAEINFVDGSALDPSHFGYTESQTGLWRPKRFDKSRIPNKKGTTFSSTWTASGNGFGSAPVTRAYAGDLSSYANNSAGGQILTWNTSTYNLSGNLRIYCYSNGGAYDIYVNGNATKVADTPSESGNVAWVDCGTFDHIKEIQFAGTTYNTSNDLGGGGVYFSGFMVDGTLLRDDMDEFGTNGFHLDFSDNSSTTTLGLDKSGQGNNFTPEDVSVSAGAGNDSLEDTPTNNFCTLNSIQYGTGNATKVTLSNGNLNFSDSSSSNKAAVSTFGLKSGKYYFELLSTNTGTYSIGMTDLTTNNGSFYRNNGSYSSSFGGGGTSGYASWTTNDVIGVAVDFDNGKIWYAKNNTWQSGDPSTGNSPTNTFTSGLTLHVEIYTDNSSGTKSGSLNFGQRAFSYTPPTGYKKLNSKNLPPNVPSIIRPQKHFETLLYTGTGSSNSVTGLEFAPDFIWAKRRDSGGHHHLLVDSIRGGSKSVMANLSDAENSNANRDMTFLANGIRWNSNTGNANASSGTYVVWSWKGGGAAVSNTDGSITTSVSANTEAGFSIVKFTITSNAVYTVGHGLGKAPQWIMMKALSGGDNSGTTNWDCYHVAIGNTKRFKLNSRDAAQDYTGPWNDTTPTSSVFTSTGSWLGGNGTNVIAYCWTEIPGYSKFGSYTGNGSSDGPYVHLGFRPAWILIKADLSESWYLYDNKRDVDNVVNNELRADHDYAAGTFTIGDFLSNGFKIRATDSAANGNGSTYVYIAFAEQPGTTPFETFPNAR